MPETSDPDDAQNLKHLGGGDGQDITAVRQRSRIVVRADACPLLGEGPTLWFPLSLDGDRRGWTRSLRRYRFFQPQFLSGVNFWVQHHFFPFLSEVRIQEFTKLEPTSP
jgi:hypothetical protein